MASAARASAILRRPHTDSADHAVGMPAVHQLDGGGQVLVGRSEVGVAEEGDVETVGAEAGRRGLELMMGSAGPCDRRGCSGLDALVIRPATVVAVSRDADDHNLFSSVGAIEVLTEW
ncbi:hypothetical protein [Lentzea albidocapillata]|uniref:hypothetical protein n=1 Tax=Lentzea albidocapillata TaxID=40571 RepID=UPI001184650D|nr:hypothetical protein [Lentzea albidocapillata]